MLFIKLKMRIETGCAWKVENKFSCYALYQTSLLVAGYLLLVARCSMLVARLPCHGALAGCSLENVV